MIELLGLGGTGGTERRHVAVPDATPFTPPYKYPSDAASDVPAVVMKYAGPQ